MDTEWILRIILLGVTHWILAGILLQDLAYRPRVFGGRKWIWAVIITVITCFGSLLYLLFHPQILNPDFEQQEQTRHKRKKPDSKPHS